MKTTPLNALHLALGAKMVPFAGYSMPIQYSSITAEHLAVRQKAGMFDVSHMGEFWIRGEGALDFLQYVSLNDAAKLKLGRAQYSMLPNQQGGVVDDIYLYHTGEQEYLMVVNAANIDKDWAHLTAHSSGFKVDSLNASDHFALIAVQGPQAAEILQGLSDTNLLAHKKNDTFVASVAGKTARLARTGYTGEDGFEVFVSPEDAGEVWKALHAAGVMPCGLGARDTLRLEAGFPLYGHELTDQTNPRATPFSWVIKEYKEFLGKTAMLGAVIDQRLVGLLVEGGVPREGYPVVYGGQPLGILTSGTHSPMLKKGIAMAYVPKDLAVVGTKLEVEIRGKATPATVVETPFVSL